MQKTQIQPYRPDELPANAVEPRCRDIVEFHDKGVPGDNYCAGGGLFKVSTTSRYERDEYENKYSFSEINGDRSFTVTESEYVALFDTDKNARWPTVYPRTDMGLTRRRQEDGSITKHRRDRE